MAAPSSAATDGPLKTHLADPLYRTAYLLIIGSAATSGLGLVFWAVAAHSYSARVVGLGAAAISAMVLLSGACQLGLNTALVRYVPVAGPTASALVIRSYAVTAALSFAGGVGVALASPLWSPSLGFLAHSAAWVIGFAAATTCWTVFSLQDAVMTGLKAARWVPIENGLFSIAKLVLLVTLTGAAAVWAPFVAWNAPVAAAVVAVTWLIFGRLIPAQARAPGGQSRPRRRPLLGVAAGNYAASLFSLGVTYLTPVIVTDATNPTKTAYFYAPWLIASGLLLVANNTSTSLTVEGALDEARLALLFRRSLLHTARLLTPLVALVALTAPLILAVFGSRYHHAGAPLLRLLALGALPNAVVTLGLAVARVEQRGWLLIAIQAGEFAPLVALSLILLPGAGIVGVGYAFLASQSVVAAALLLSVLRPLFWHRPQAAGA